MQNLTTVLDWIRYATSKLMKAENEAGIIFAHGNINAVGEAHTLVLGLLDLPFDLEPSYFLAKLTTEEIDKIAHGLDERINHYKPTAYITNRSLFMGLEFYVDERVLIPRSPIKDLIEQAFSPYIDNPNSVCSILDLCCGSGCIGIASSYLFPDAEIYLADIDKGALEVCHINVERHDMNHITHIVESNLFSGLNDLRFDLIITNPPYVDADTMASLPQEFYHEPDIALASGQDGLDCAKLILKQAYNHLTENGILVLEVGASWTELDATYPDVNFNWHSFNNGCEGVLVMSYNELKNYHSYF